MKRIGSEGKRGSPELLLPRSVLKVQNKTTSGLINKSNKLKYFPTILTLPLPFTESPLFPLGE